MIGVILLPVSAIGYILTTGAITPYREYAFSNGFVPDSLSLEWSRLELVLYSFIGAGALGLKFIVYGLFKGMFEPKQRQ